MALPEKIAPLFSILNGYYLKIFGRYCWLTNLPHKNLILLYHDLVMMGGLYVESSPGIYLIRVSLN